jgi:hypothetical protein
MCRMPPDVRSQYFALADELSNIALLYMHVLDHSAMGAPPVPLNAPDAAGFYVPGPKGYTDYPNLT